MFYIAYASYDDTRIMDILNLNRIPSGEMVIVVLHVLDIIRKIHLSLTMRWTVVCSYLYTEKVNKKVQGDEEIRCRPDKEDKWHRLQL